MIDYKHDELGWVRSKLANTHHESATNVHTVRWIRVDYRTVSVVSNWWSNRRCNSLLSYQTQLKVYNSIAND